MTLYEFDKWLDRLQRRCTKYCDRGFDEITLSGNGTNPGEALNAINEIRNMWKTVTGVLVAPEAK